MSTLPLPKWAMLRYAKLWQTYGRAGISYAQMQETLAISDNLLSVTISQLKKAGWLTIELDPSDARKRIYTLTSPTEAVEGMVE